ncbi:MAG: stage III sporulation protein AE [Firmicutes bacterium]|nr:stage III sporulation protein AE [Bacillota bacterium]
MDYEKILTEQLDQVMDGEDIDGIMDKVSQLTEGISDEFTMENILQSTLSGESFFQNQGVIDSLKSLMLYEIKGALILGVEVLSICIIIGLLKSLSDSFSKKTVSQLSLLVCTMVVIGISINSFRISYELALDTVSTMVYTMEILTPILIGVLLATGAVASGTILSPVIIGAVTGFGFLVSKLILPALFLSTILGLINCLTEKNYVNKLAKLIRNAAVFITGFLLTVLTGIITLQGILTEASDGLLINATKYSLSSFIPIVGGFTSDTVELFLQCMGAIKSVVGVFGLVILILMLLIPLLKILIVGGVYKLTSAMVEPVTDGKIADGLNDMGTSMISIGSILFFTSLLFILFISIILKIGGGS